MGIRSCSLVAPILLHFSITTKRSPNSSALALICQLPSLCSAWNAASPDPVPTAHLAGLCSRLPAKQSCSYTLFKVAPPLTLFTAK